MYGYSRADAVTERVRTVAREHGCDLWKPWLRELAGHTTVLMETTEEVPIA